MPPRRGGGSYLGAGCPDLQLVGKGSVCRGLAAPEASYCRKVKWIARYLQAVGVRGRVGESARRRTCRLRLGWLPSQPEEH